MLVFFIHGVATRDVQYANTLKEALRKEISQHTPEQLHCYSSFWGNALNDIEKIWNNIDQDLQSLQPVVPETEIKDYLRYRDFRREFLSKFVGDMFTYLNPQRGYEIRKKIAQDLINFLKENSQETDLHIITHSLGCVILWDILFSNRFQEKDPAFYIRALIKKSRFKNRQIFLRGIVTMGSPITFFNTMLGVEPQIVREFIQSSSIQPPLRWLNIIHRSDLIAYPLRSSVGVANSDSSQFKDAYIDTNNDVKADVVARLARSIGQDTAAMTFDAVAAHQQYWNCPRTIQLIFDHIQARENTSTPDKENLQEVIEVLNTIPGITTDKLKLHINAHPEKRLKLKDGSGTLIHLINPARIHHVYLFDGMNVCRFAGYVGWMDTNALKAVVELVERSWC